MDLGHCTEITEQSEIIKAQKDHADCAVETFI